MCIIVKFYCVLFISNTIRKLRLFNINTLSVIIIYYHTIIALIHIQAIVSFCYYYLLSHNYHSHTYTGYCRLTLKPYSLDLNTLDDPTIHLTNAAIQKQGMCVFRFMFYYSFRKYIHKVRYILKFI